ncbi:MAG: hypothetical protein DPW09_29415 [Anaerolineae bacterium]|nr:hypothetical protein [Anaerolineae bacterium]
MPEAPAPAAPEPPAASFPAPPGPPRVTVNRQQMRSLLPDTAPAPERKEVSTELTPLQLARAYERNSSPEQIYRLIRQGTPIPRLAGALGLPLEMVKRIYYQQKAIHGDFTPLGQAVKMQQQGLDFSQIGEKLGVSEAEAKMLYARGHVKHFGANPAVQIGRKEGTPFPGGIFPQPTYNRETNRDSASINKIIGDLTRELEPQGLSLQTDFEADALGGRHVVRVVKDGEFVGQPFRLTATPSGVPLISKTGRGAGGYRLAFPGQGISLTERLSDAIRTMAANHSAARANQPPAFGDPNEPDWYNDDLLPPPDDYAYDGDDFGFDSSENIPPPPPNWDEDEGMPASLPLAKAPLTGNAKGPLNVLDLLDVNGKLKPDNKKIWRQINAGDFTRLSHAGQFRDENSEALAKNEWGQWAYPEGLDKGYYYPATDPYFQPEVAEPPLTPVVSKGSVYPLEARNYIAGNIDLGDGRQWGSQKSQGKQMKRDELSLTRKYWQAGPALGVAYPEVPQHILGQRATEPETAHIAKAFILDRGGIIPEGQMWKDANYAPWVFGSFEQNPEKFELRFDPNYSEQEVLKAAGLWDEAKGGFKPRVLKQGRGKISAPNGFSKDVLRNNEAGVITGYEIVDTLRENGEPVKALRIKGYFGNRPNVVSAMKLEGWKNLAQDKHIREDMGLDYDLIMNKPSDSVVANISMLNALPREEFESYWREVYGETPAPGRTSSMESVEALAKVWQLYQERNRRTEILPGRVFDKDTLQNYLDAGIIKDGKYEEVAPLFEGAETMYKADLVASGFMAPVRVKYITDVTRLNQGNLSHDILRSMELNHPGLGEYLRELGYEGRDAYNTLFEMHQLNTKPGPSTSPSTSSGGASGHGWNEAGSPVVDLLGDLLGNQEAQAGMQALYEQRLAEILPQSMAGLSEQDYNSEQQAAYKKFKNEAGAEAIRRYYAEALGTDSYIFRLGDNNQSSYMVNPGLLEKFGYIDEETNEKISKIKNQGDYQLKRAWEVTRPDNQGGLAKFLKWLPKSMKDIIAAQEELLASPSARKRWFGTSSSTIRTHVHASDYALPRNAGAASWEDIFQMFGLKPSRANRATLNRLSRAGQLLFGGIRNPASDPIAQTGAILNMLTPDILQDAGLDIPTTGHPIIFHPHQVQRQGGDNDSDESQVYPVLKGLANAFGLKLSTPEEITAGAKIHAAGEYEDAIEKLNVSPEKAQRNLLGFDPTLGDLALDGRTETAEGWTGGTLRDYKLNSRQIGQAYNIPIRIGIGLAKKLAAKRLISQYGGWMYQNPLDKVNYETHSPEEDLFSFFTSFNAFTGSFSPSRAEDESQGTYYSFRKKFSKDEIRFDNRGQFGAAGLLAILKRMTMDREGTQAKMTPEQMAAMMSRSSGDIEATARMIEDNWTFPAWEELDSVSIQKLRTTEAQRKALETFASGDSVLAQMMRGFAVRNALKGAGRLQRKLQVGMLDPEMRAKLEGPKSKFRGDLREYVNVLQNDMYNFGGPRGLGSDEFKADYKKYILDEFAPELAGENNNWFYLLEPGNEQKDKAPGKFYTSWAPERRQKFYQYVGRLIQKYMTGYEYDREGRLIGRDESVSRNNPMLRDWYQDYDRIRDMMAINAKDRGEDDIESFVPTLDELGKSEVTGPLVREKFNRKQKLLGGLGRLFDRFKEVSGLNGASEIGQDFENFVSGKKPYTAQEEEMWRQAELGHEEARRLKRQRWEREGYNEPMYFAEGGVLDRATRIGKTQNGRDIVAGEAGREYVVPEGKTRDLGNGVKIFDEDSLGPGAPEGSQPVMLAKGGLIDYQGYANAPTSTFADALRQIAQEITQGAFNGSLDEARRLVGQAIEADIQKMMANPPQNGGKGLYATDITGRMTDRISQALGPNPAQGDRDALNAFLSEYGLSADFQPLDVRSSAVDLATRKQLAAAGTGIGDFLKNISAQVQGKVFSHANYGHIYNAIPGWTSFWGSGRPGATIPNSPLTGAGAAKLAQLAAGPPPAGSGGNMPGMPPPGPVGPTTPVQPAQTGPANPPREIVTVPKLTPQMMGEYRHIFDQIGALQGFNPYDANAEQIASLKLAGQRGTDIFKIAQRSKNLIYQQELVDLAGLGINTAQKSEFRRLIETYGNGDPDLVDNIRGFTEAEQQDLINNIYAMNQGDESTQKAERYLFGRLEELHRNVRERGLSLTDTQIKAWDRYGLAYQGVDPEQLRLAREFDDFFSTEFPQLGNVTVPLTNQKGEPTYLGGAHPNFDPAFVSQVLPQAHAARLKYEASEKFKNLTPAAVASMRPDVAAVMSQAEAVPFAQEQYKQRLKADKQAARLAQVDRRLADVQEFYRAKFSGQADAFSSSMQTFDDAAQVALWSSQRQQAYEAAVPLKRQYDEALQRGDLGTAQRLWDQLDPLNTRIGELKDQIGTLTPHIKEHIDTLGQQTTAIREDLKERKATYTALAARHDELVKEKAELSGAARLSKAADIGTVRGEMDAVRAEIKSQAKELGRLEMEKRTLSDLIHEPQGRAITGLNKRPLTYGQMALNELKEGYSPQRLFWEFQNIQQMQYMAFMPMLQTRDQYLAQQAALGQANYALGAGSMPQSVLSAMASQANMSRATTAFGQGVDNSLTMGLWKGLTGFLGQNEGAGSFLGAAGFDLTSGLTAAMGLKMVGGPALSAIGKLLPALGVKAAPYYLPGGGPGLAATSMAALGSGGGLVAGGLGLGLGLGLNEYLASQNAGGNVLGLDWAAQPLSKHLTVAAYESAGYTGDMWGGMFNPANSWLLRGLADKTGLAGAMGWDLWNQEAADAAGTAVGKYTGAVTKPLPVWVTKMEDAVAKQLGVSKEELPFDRMELGQMVQMAAEDQGITKAQIEGATGIAEQLAREIAESYTSGVSLSQSSSLRQRAIDVSGYAPGTEGAKMMSAWVQQGSLFERQQRLQAASMTQGLAEAMDFTPQQRRDMSEKVYDLLAGGMSQAQIGRSMQQRSMSNQFYWSAAAYASGQPDMALMDQDKPWLPKNQEAMWAIENRRRAEDNARELGSVILGTGGFQWQGGRQETELGWQRQQLDLEKEFWDFRRKSQLEDFGMQQKLFDFNIRQQRQAIEWEEKQSRVQSAYYEKQYAINKKIFDLQTEWQIKDFNKQEFRMDVQRSWQLEDSAWNRESFNLQAGWQMEDMQRALRYASSGRERMDIRRQMERQSTLNERKRTEFDREDARNSTQYTWAKEDLAEQRRRFEEMNELQREQMELGRSYWQEQQSMASAYREARRASLEEQIALQQEQNALTVQQFLDGMALQDKQHALETQIQETKYQWALDDLDLARQRAKEDEVIAGWQQQSASASYFYAFYQAMGYDAAKKAKPELEAMADAAGELADAMERYQTALSGSKSIWDQMPTPNNPAGPQAPLQSMNLNNRPDGPMSTPPPYVGSPIMKGFAGGGYTGDGDPGEVAGIVHRGEYVVPQGGALVMKDDAGSAEVVALLSAILLQLQDGGGTILIDAERLKKAGFLHQSNFSQVYR